MNIKKKSKLKLTLIVIVILLIVLVGSFYIYTLDYYRADAYAIQTLSADTTRIENYGKMTVFYPSNQLNNKTGLIFYPGGKIEAIAYAPLLKKLSHKGITCVLIKMPLNLAIFNINAANAVYDKFSHIQNWYLVGHSLGGAMASSYVKKNSHKLKGLILLGAYPINDADIPTLAIYGSEDLGLNKAKLKSVKNKLEIKGGNHAYFGNYGEQKGDGVATITREQQQKQTVKEIVKFISNTE